MLCLCCASWIAPGAHAQATLDRKTDRIDLWPHVRVLADATRTLGAAEALAAADRFTSPPGAYATLGMDKQVVWLRIPLAVAQGGDGLWVLDIDYALLHRADVFVARGGSVERRATLGHEQPFAGRPLPGRSHAAPLELSAGAAELLVRIDTPGAKILPLSLSRLSAFHAGGLHEHLLQGALGGLALVLLLLSLAQWVSLREVLYLKYALLVFFSMMFSVHFFGLGEMYLWTDLAWPERHMAGVTALMAAAATALFVEDALAGDLRKGLRVGLNVLAAVNVSAAIAHGIDLIDIQTVAIFMSTTGLAPALLGLPGALAMARRGNSVGAWFIVAWLGYFTASAIMVGVVRGRIDASFWTLHSFQIGATLDMLVFMRIAVLRTAARHRAAQRAVRERDTLHSMAHTDPLTGLLNRRGLDDALAEALPRATPERFVALYVIDLDGFKPVNDRYGHDVGDELLRIVAQRLRATMRGGDAVARLGGDEFVVMAKDLTSAAQAEELGRKLLDDFRAPFAIGRQTCAVGATVGYALAPEDASDAGRLLKAADAAMYAGKESGKDRVARVARPSPRVAQRISS